MLAFAVLALFNTDFWLLFSFSPRSGLMRSTYPVKQEQNFLAFLGQINGMR